MRLSVCIATYNGEKYIEKQLNSILKLISKQDEVIIVDDCSKDTTPIIISRFNDNRITLIKNQENLGVNESFEKALLNAKGDIIFLSDQDDIWLEDKVGKILHIFSTEDVDIIQHDAIIVDDDFRVIYDSFFELRNAKSGFVKNYLSNTYLGCSMAFRRKILPNILPIPKHKGYHDRWIGIISELQGLKVMFLKEPLMHYIRHEGTGSNLKRRNIFIIICDRIDFLRVILNFYIRKIKTNFEFKK